MNLLSPLTARSSMMPRISWPYQSEDMMRSFDNLIDNFFEAQVPMTTQGLTPRCDISEAKDYYLISLDMPGVHKSDIHIEVSEGQLTVSGERSYEMKAGDKGSELRKERGYGKFQRVFTLTNQVKAENIEAHYEDGVLNIALPKKAATRGREVTIHSGKSRQFSRLLGSSKKKEAKEVKNIKAS